MKDNAMKNEWLLLKSIEDLNNPKLTNSEIKKMVDN